MKQILINEMKSANTTYQYTDNWSQLDSKYQLRFKWKIDSSPFSCVQRSSILIHIYQVAQPSSRNHYIV